MGYNNLDINTKTLLALILQFSSDYYHRCRNQGGHDFAPCSQLYQPNGQFDYACEYYKPYARYCHIPGLNGPSNTTHFEFTPFESFDSDLARITCEKVGGKVPSLISLLDTIWFIKAVEYLSSFVRFGWPYSYRWSSWPVSYHNNEIIVVGKATQIILEIVQKRKN